MIELSKDFKIDVTVEDSGLARDSIRVSFFPAQCSVMYLTVEQARAFASELITKVNRVEVRTSLQKQAAMKQGSTEKANVRGLTADSGLAQQR